MNRRPDSPILRRTVLAMGLLPVLGLAACSKQPAPEVAETVRPAYVVEARPALGQGEWSPWVTVPARSTNSLERLNDPAPGARKFYRLRTPAGD